MSEHSKGMYPPTPEEMAEIMRRIGESDAFERLGEDEAPEHRYDLILESICRVVDDSQDVELYDGTLGVSTGFVGGRERPVGQLQWNGNLPSIYSNPGNVNNIRWGTGTLITENLFLTAGHNFDSVNDPFGWRVPLDNISGAPITPAEIASNMHVNFNFQRDPSGALREEREFGVVDLVEYRLGGLDYAIVQLAGDPGRAFGRGFLAETDAAVSEMLCIIGHPAGVPKRIEAGPLTSFGHPILGGDYLAYDDIDTLGGNSGSAVWHGDHGRIVGVHTNGGCDTAPLGMANYAVRIARIIEESPQVSRMLVRRAINNFTIGAGGWVIGRHPRFVEDVTGSNGADIVGFGNGGVHVALSNGDGTFGASRLVLANFGESPEAGNWQVARHPRTLANVSGENGADIVGFGNGGVHVALSNGDGTFRSAGLVLENFGESAEAGGWQAARHPRVMADITGDGKADIVGFGTAGVHTALSNGDGTFRPVGVVVDNFGYDAGGWRVEKHLRVLADITGENGADIIGFGDAGVSVATSMGNGRFRRIGRVLDNFGYDAGGWRIERHPRFLARITPEPGADIIGFGNQGVYVALSNGDGTFRSLGLVLENFGEDPAAGGWDVARHPRFMADVNGDGLSDIVGFGERGVYVALSNGDGTFRNLGLVVDDFGHSAGGWQVDRHPRFMADIDGDGRDDIVGFGEEYVIVRLM